MVLELLFKIFVKDKDNVKDERVRNRYGVLGGAVGIVLNILLFVFKLVAGIITSSVGIAADALNNLSDVGSSVITLIGFRMAGRPADNDHPFGHGRGEYISGLFVSFFILLMGVELVKTSISKMFNPTSVEFTFSAMLILVLSILLKLWMYFFNIKISQKIDSQAMKATAKDSLSDVLSTTAVLAGLLASKFFDVNIDGYIGFLMAVVILYAGYKTLKEAISPLLGARPDNNLVKQIERIVMSCDNIIGMHDLVIHNYGPNHFMMSVHAEVSADCDILTIHHEIDMVEKKLSQEFGCDAVIHIDPVETDNVIINATRKVVESTLKDIDERLSVHDFRMITGDAYTNVVFDVVIPFEVKLSDRFVVDMLKQKISEFNSTYFAVIHVDKSN